METEPKQRNCFALFASHCFLPLFILVLFFIIFLLSVLFVYVGPFYSSSSEIDSLTPPIFIAQLTDVHYHDLLPERTKHNVEVMKSLLENFNPSIFTITGDIVDSSDSKSSITYHKNVQGNWDEWNKSYFETGLAFRDILFIPTAGNHEEMAVASDTKEDHPYRRYFLKDDEDFIFRSFFVENGAKKPLNIVTFNPIFPPSSSGPLCMLPYVEKELTQKLASKVKKDCINVLLCHFPRGIMWSGPGASSKLINDATKKYDLMLAGHTHPPSLEIAREDGFLHVTGCVGKRCGNFSLVTFDNNIPAVHNLDPKSKNQLVVTYPISAESITSNTVFNKHSFDVHVLSFSGNTNADIRLTIDGKVVTDKMNYKATVKEGVTYFTFPVKDVSDGFHDIRVSSPDCTEYQMRFFVGEKYPKTRVKTSFTNQSLILMTIGLATSCTIYSLIRIIPLWLIPCVKDFLKDFSEIIENKKEEKTAAWKVLLLGCLDYLTRFRSMTLLSYIVLIVDSLWYFFIPMYIAPIDYKKIVVFSWGTTVDGKINFHGMNIFIWWVYILMFLMPFGSFTALLNENGTKLYELVLLMAVVVFILIAWFFAANFAGEVLTLFASPMPYIAFISVFLVFFDHYYLHRNRDNKVTVSKDDIKQITEL